MPLRIAKVCLGIVLGLSTATPAWAANNNFVEQVKKPVREAIETRQTIQKEEEIWRDEKRNLMLIYEQLQGNNNRLQDRKDQLQQEMAATHERIKLKEKQLENTEKISTRMMPFLQALVGRMSQQISDDIPFLATERKQRMDRLTHLMKDPEVSVSEKFRKSMEALLVEAEYGSTTEVYQQTIAVDKASTLVNIFRLGRISLFYQTLDQKRCGFYDVATAGWLPLPTVFNRAIKTAIEIAAKRRPVELLTLPLGRVAKQ